MFTSDDYDNHYALKEQGLEAVLGPMHNLVGHAIVPFRVGGPVDMYRFRNAIDDTAFATMENGSGELIARLKRDGYYPFSGLDRPSVA